MGSKFEVVPIAQLASGKFVKGKVAGASREVKLNGKNGPYIKWVHELYIVDASSDLKFVAKNDKGEYVDVTLDEGAKASVWATKSLHEKLEMFPEGTLISIKEDGQEDAGGEFKRRKFIVKMEKV